MVVVRDDPIDIQHEQAKDGPTPPPSSKNGLEKDETLKFGKHYGDMAKRLMEMENKMEDIRNKVKMLQAKKQSRTDAEKKRQSRRSCVDKEELEKKKSTNHNNPLPQTSTSVNAVNKIAGILKERTQPNIKTEKDKRDKLRDLFEIYLKQAVEKNNKSKQDAKGVPMEPCPRPTNAYECSSTSSGTGSRGLPNHVSSQMFNNFSRSWINKEEQIPSKVNLLYNGMAYSASENKEKEESALRSRMVVANDREKSHSTHRSIRKRFKTEYNETIGATAALVEREARSKRPLLDSNRHLRHSRLFPETSEDEDSIPDSVRDDKPSFKKLQIGSRNESMVLQSVDVLVPATRTRYKGNT